MVYRVITDHRDHVVFQDWTAAMELRVIRDFLDFSDPRDPRVYLD